MKNTPIEKRIIVQKKDLSNYKVNDFWHSRDDKNSKTISYREGRIIGPFSKDHSLIPKLVEMTDSSRDFICISSFLLQESEFTNSILKACARGVRVYILTASQDDLKELPEELLSDNRREMIENQKALLDNLCGQTLMRTGDHFHAKFALFDPVSRNAKGVLSTCNLVVDAMSGNNHEIAVELRREEILSLYNQFIIGFWKEAKNELLEKGRLSAVGSNKIPNLSMDNINHPFCMKVGGNLYEIIKEMIGSAKKSIVIGAWTVNGCDEIEKILVQKADAGVDVKVITRPIERNTKSAFEMAKSGVRFYGLNRFHAKVLIVDDIKGMVFTANIDNYLGSSYESGVILEGNDVKELSSVVNEWIKNADEFFFKEKPLSEIQTDKIKVFNFNKGVFIETRIDDNQILPNQNLTVELENLQEFEPNPELVSPNTPSSNVLYRTVQKQLTVEPKKLPSKNIEVIKIERDFLITKSSDGNIMIPVSFQEEIEMAKSIANGVDGKIVFANNDIVAALRKKFIDSLKEKTVEEKEKV